jgi:hypothetical protein
MVVDGSKSILLPLLRLCNNRMAIDPKIKGLGCNVHAAKAIAAFF